MTFEINVDVVACFDTILNERHYNGTGLFALSVVIKERACHL